jgi:hypothetical protein
MFNAPIVGSVADRPTKMPDNAGVRWTWIRPLLWAVLVISSTIAGLAFLHWLRWLPGTELGRVDQISSGLGPPVAIAGLLVSIASWWGQRAIAPSWKADEQETVVHDHLARQLSRLLAEEATRRELHPPYLQPIRWAADTASGSIHDLAEFFVSIPARQLVILGAAGSGKSSMALRLAIDVLGRGELVPVMLSVSSWDCTQSLDNWLATTLLRDHPQLGDAQRFGKGAVSGAAGRILPVLDGFDEISPGSQAPVLRRLRDELAAGRPLVLVSQEKPFRDAVVQSGVTLARTTEIEVQPLGVAEAARYLVAGQHRGDERWHDVIEQIEQKPRGGLARLLSSPLMIYLARTAYEDPRTDPRDLTAMTVRQARTRLMSSFLPAIYSERADRADQSLRRYGSAAAERWLRFLARRMAARGMQTLPWWRVPDLSPAAILTLRVTVALVAFVFVGMRYGLPIGLIVATVAGRSVGSLRPSRRPNRLVLRAGAVGVGAVLGGASGILAAVVLIPGGGLLVAMLFGLVISLTAILVLNVAMGRTRDEGGNLDLRRWLREDRTVMLAIVAISIVSGLRSAAQWGPWMGIQQFARGTIFIMTTLAFAEVGVPWLRFAWTRLVLAVARRLPARLVTFLEDAHRRGVLKRSGAAYEFRHSSFLRYLSS